MEGKDGFNSFETVDYGPDFEAIAKWMVDRGDLVSFRQTETNSPEDQDGIDFFVSRKIHKDIPLQVVSDGKNRREHLRKYEERGKDPFDIVFVQMVEQRALRPKEEVARDLVGDLVEWELRHGSR